MINPSNYSCDKCARTFSRHCNHCIHTVDKPPTRFRPKKKMGFETPKFRKPNLVPSPKVLHDKITSEIQKPWIDKINKLVNESLFIQPVAKPKQKENKTMYGLKLYIPFEDFDTYIREHIETADQYPVFIPVKAEVNEHNLSVEISLMSAVPNEFYDCRYKLDLNSLPKENN